MPDLNSIYKDAEQKMQKNFEGFSKDLSKIRTDRAHPNLLENILVEYYDQRTALFKMANIIVEDARTLSITPFDKSAITAIEKAIVAANLGLNPVVMGTIVRVPIPPLTEERRKTLAKQIKADAENGRVAIRNVRRDANTQVKALSKNKEISLNDEKTAENKIQKLTDQYINQIDKLSHTKETEIMKI
jgi:ribosome recycling factor